jgi:Ca-activated chloride channel family protein
MNWLTLNPLQVAGVWAGLAAVALWLYLHHRRPQRKRVSTLRFWVSVQPISQPRRRKLREPWALLAQVLFLLFLILALANPRLGTSFEGRSVVIVLDASIWSQVRPAGGTPWMDQERAEAYRIVNTLPPGDRVLLLRAETAAPPILPFTTDHTILRRAIASVQPSSGTSDVPGALEIGKAALAGSRRGLLVYVGPGMLDEEQEHNLDQFRASMDAPDQPQFLVRLAGEDAPIQDRGITRLSLRRDDAQPDRWRLLTQIKNYGDAKADVVLKLSIDGQPLGQRKIALAPNELANAENEFTWESGGMLQAELSPSDVLGADDRAIVNLPTFRMIQVAVFAYGNSPFASDLLSVLSNNPYVEASNVASGTELGGLPDVAVYLGATLPAQSSYNSIYFISGPSTGVSRSVRATQWNTQHPVTRWVRTHDVNVRNPAMLQLLPGDTVLAYAEGTPPAPLIVAREQNGRRILIVGFDPHDSNLPLQSAFPLLMAGAMEWMTHSVDEQAESHSTGELDLPGPANRIVAPSGRDVSFARKGAEVHLLALETGIYKIIGPGGETSVAVNTPLLPARRLKASTTETAGIQREPLQAEGSNLWRWLVILGIVALWLEWWLYYSSRELQRSSEVQHMPTDEPLRSMDQELEAQKESESRSPISLPR